MSYLVQFLVGLLVDLHRGHRLLHVAQDHVEVLIVSLGRENHGHQLGSSVSPVTVITACASYMQAPAELPVVPHLDVDPLVQTESDQIQRLLHRVGSRLLPARGRQLDTRDL